MAKGYYAIDIGVRGQAFRCKPSGNFFHHTSRAIDGRQNANEVARAHLAIGGRSVLKLLDDPAMRERLTKAGAQLAPLTSPKFTEMHLKDIALWKRIILAAGIKLE